VKRDKPKSGKGKRPGKNDAPPPPLDAEALRLQHRVAEIRDKLRVALDDPEKRQQMVEAIRSMMRTGTEN
jgi:hypothetical protein